MCWVAAILLFLAHMYVVQSQEDLSNIFHLMYFYGDKYRETARQYLVVTLLTSAEYKESADWANLDPLLNHKNGNRVKYYLNDEYPDLPETGSDLKHGEIIFLYLDGDAPKQLENMLPDHPAEELPVMIFFSLYIPCACVENCNFNCAEELSHAAKHYREKFKFVVGYAKVFIGKYIKGTDEDQAEDFMKKGGIQMYKYVKDTFKYEPLQVVPYLETTGKPSDVLQNNLVTLLVESPVSVCVASTTEEKMPIAAAFLNKATSNCFELKRCNYYGGLTKLNKHCLYNCLYDYVQDNIGNDCDRLPTDLNAILYSFEEIIDNALRQSLRVGYPTIGGNFVYLPVEDNMLWQNVYTQSRNKYAGLADTNTASEPVCLKRRDLSVASFCTKKTPVVKPKTYRKRQTSNSPPSLKRRKLL